MTIYSYSTGLGYNTSQLESLVTVSTVIGIIGVISFIIAVIICAVLADRKGRSVGGWIFGGLCLGWIGVIILCCLSDLKCNNRMYQSTSSNKVSGSNTRKVGIHVCKKCGETIDTVQCPWCGAFGDREKIVAEKTQECWEAVKKINKEKEVMPSSKRRCENCGEMIDTEQCPWCGTRKSK